MGKEAIVVINPRVRGTSRVWLAEVDVTIITDNENASFLREPLYSKRFTGSAVKNPLDREDSKVGCELALGRALESAGKRLQRIAWNNIPSHPVEEEVKVAKPKPSRAKTKSK